MTNPYEELMTRLLSIEGLLTELNTKDTRKKPLEVQASFDKVPVQEIFSKGMLSKPTFYRHVKEGTIQLYKLGGRSYVDVNQFNEVFHKVKLSA